MTKIILFNGPASSGKDTMSNQLATRIPRSLMVKFAEPLKKMAMHMYCDSDSQKFHHYDSPEEKVKANVTFLGKSCRQVQIDISEVYMKPVHGQDVMGKFLVKKIEAESENHDVFFVSDSGFRPEAEVLVNEYGAQNILLIRLIRKGELEDIVPYVKFAGDSRSYIDLSDLDVKTIDVKNTEGDINPALDTVLNAVNEFIKGN